MNGRKITAAAIQMSSTSNKVENLDTAELLIRSAASSGADLIALPELWTATAWKTSTRRIPSLYQGRRQRSSAALLARSNSSWCGRRAPSGTRRKP